MVSCYKASEQWAKMMEKQPSCRLWCVVEIQAALENSKPVVLKVGTFKLKDLPPEEPELPPVSTSSILVCVCFLLFSFVRQTFDIVCYVYILLLLRNLSVLFVLNFL